MKTIYGPAKAERRRFWREKMLPVVRGLEERKMPSEVRSLWYDKHWRSKETPEFVRWWAKFYGPAEGEQDDIDEHYRRKGFALMGWLARGEMEPKP